MPLSNSGPISFNDVRVEMSQSTMTNYDISGWQTGKFDHYPFAPTLTISQSYAPVNTTTGSYGSEYWNNGLPITTSAWYNYNHTSSKSSSQTASVGPTIGCGTSVMTLMDAGTTSKTWQINISGSMSIGVDSWRLYYGRPWYDNGQYISNYATIPGCDYITGSDSEASVNWSFNYSYTYDASKGRYLYLVLYDVCG